MAHARKRKLRTGIFWYMVPDDRAARPEPCGPGRRGKILAQRWASKVNELKYSMPAGLAPARRCSWTLADLRREDLAEAARRGLRTAQPQRQGRISRRESHWNNLAGFFLKETNLDEITQARIRDYIDTRSKKVGPVGINRDLWGVLKPALRLARELEESGYSADPFARLRKLDETGKRRPPIALPEREAEKFIRVCWTVHRPLGAYAELLFLTASRLNQEGTVDGGFLRYPPHKRGIPRSFRLDERLRRVLAAPRAFSREKWRAATRAFGVDLNPHDLRHTRLTLEGGRPRATLLSIQKWGGWRSPLMAAEYLHPDASAIRRAGRLRA